MEILWYLVLSQKYNLRPPNSKHLLEFTPIFYLKKKMLIRPLEHLQQNPHNFSKMGIQKLKSPKKNILISNRFSILENPTLIKILKYSINLLKYYFSLHIFIFKFSYWSPHFVIIFGVISIFGEKNFLSPTFSILGIVLEMLLEQIISQKSPFLSDSPFWGSSWRCSYDVCYYFLKRFSPQP